MTTPAPGSVVASLPDARVDSRTTALYARVLGNAWTQLAEPVRALHATRSLTQAHGRFRIERGNHYYARLLARMLRLPRSSASADTRLVVTDRGDGEQWERTFDSRRLTSRQYEAGASVLAERFGALELRFRLEARDGSLVFVQQDAAWRFGRRRVKFPPAWALHVAAREDPAGPQRVNVSVRCTLPRIGLLIAYDGTIEVEDRRA